MKADELRMILEEGEGHKIEFKEKAKNIDKEMVAFANASGGRIFLGIADDGTVKGVSVTNALKSQVQDVANNCEPPVKIVLKELENILVVEVRESADKPCKCASGFYTRVGPNSQKMGRNEIIEFFKEEGKIRFDELINLKFYHNESFDEKKLDRFLRMAGISKVMDVPSILVNLGVCEKQEGRQIFNNTGILFFSKHLSDTYFHTVVTCALYKGKEKVDVLDRRDFNEDIVGNIDGAMNFLKQYIPVRYEMTGEPQRREIPEIPYEALREAIINAVAHRNYFEKGANVMVEMFDDRIEITSPGGLVKGLRPEEFGTKSVLRNPNIAGLLHRIGYIEKMGTGINKMRKMVAEAGLPEVEFRFSTFFTTVFKRPERKKEEGLFSEKFRVTFSEKFRVKGKRLDRIIKILEGVIQGRFSAVPSMAEAMGVTERTLYKDMRTLQEWGILRFEGPPKTGRYTLTKQGKKMVEELRA